MNELSKGLLKVISILFIIFGIIATVISIVGLIATYHFGGIKGIIIFSTMIPTFVVSILELVLGIIGLKKCGDPSKGGFFITTGIILCILSLVNMTLSITGGGFDVTILGIPTITLIFIGLVLSIFYIIGGYTNKKAVPPVA